jgi:hypothetical protein
MKIKIFYLLLLLLPFIALGQQKKPREILRGHIIADSLRVDDVTVQNLSSHINAVTDSNGYFTIYARQGDTLFFNSITLRSQYLILKENQLKENPLNLKMDTNVINLQEVIITPLTGDLGYDSKKKKVVTLNPHVSERDLQNKYPISKQPVNGALYKFESDLKGIDFIAIGKMIFKKKKKVNSKGEIYDSNNTKTFNDVVSGRFTYYFFTETLHIPHDEIGQFLVYCDKGAQTRPLLDPKKDFELTDYLVTQAEAYLKEKK